MFLNLVMRLATSRAAIFAAVAFCFLLIAPPQSLAQLPPPPGFSPISNQMPPAAVGTDPNEVSFEVTNYDVSLGLLEAILGNWRLATPDSTMGALFKSLNLGILVFAAILFLYVSTVSVLRSAEDGEVLGRSWSSLFVPLRMAGGMALLFPLANGYSAVQIIVLWLATNGVGFANWTMNQTIDSFVDNQGSTIAGQIADSGALAKMMAAIMKSEVCVAELNRKMNADDPSAPPIFSGPTAQSIVTGTGTNSYGNAKWGVVQGLDYDALSAEQKQIASSYSPSQCGEIEITNFNSVMGLGNGTGVFHDAVSWATAGASKIFKGDFLNQSNLAVRRAHFNAIITASQRMQPAAFAFVNGVQDTSGLTMATQIVAAAYEYQQTIADALTSTKATKPEESPLPATFEMGQQMRDGIKVAGWVSLGAWYYQYARINSELSKMTGYVPKMTSMVGTLDSSGKSLEQALDAAISQSANNPRTVEQLQTAGRALGSSSISGFVVAASNYVTNPTTKFFGETFGVDPDNKVNAMIQLKNVGDNILSAAEILYVGKQIWNAAGENARNSPHAQTTIDEVGSKALGEHSGPKAFFKTLSKEITDDFSGVTKYIALFAAFALLAFAMMLAFWIPMAPFILWIGAITSWIVAVIEMVVAAPLWAAAHLHPEGEGMASKYGASGYMIIVEVFAKPVLLVIGFFIAARFVDPFLRFVSGLFFNSMMTINGDSVTGILTAVSFVLIYVGLCLTLVHRCFSLIHVIPNSVLRWIGSQGGSFSQVADVAHELGNKVSGYFAVSKTPLVSGGKASAIARGITDNTRNADPR